MLTIEDVKKALMRLGLKTAEVRQDHLKAATNLVDIEARTTARGLRFECQLLHSISRNKIFLWNIIHHNNSSFPFGNFYVSPENKVCFGWFLPTGNYFENWLDHVLFETISTAEGYYKIIQSEFNELPFEEEGLTMNLLDLIRSELKAPKLAAATTRQQAAVMLERILEEAVGFENMVRIGEFEFGTTKDHIINLTIEKIPFFRKVQDSPGWYVGIHTEVGLLNTTDNKLFIQFNRLNYEGFMVAYGMKYRDRKPTVVLNSQLLPDFLQSPGVVRMVLNLHNERANNLLQELNRPYHIQSLMDFKLGI